MKPNTNTEAKAIGKLYPAIWTLMDNGMSSDAILCEVISAIRMQNNGNSISCAVALKKLGVIGGTIEFTDNSDESDKAYVSKRVNISDNRGSDGRFK